MYPLNAYHVYRLWKKLNMLSLGVRWKTRPPKVYGNKFEDFVLDCLRKLKFPPPIAGRASPISGISSIRHEHDIVIRPPYASGNDFLLIECKYRKKGKVISKDDVMLFNQKALDIFWSGRIRGVPIRSLYRVFISYVPLDHNAFRFCLSHGILVLQPFYSRSFYPSKIACYPPLHAAYWHLTKRRLAKGIPKVELTNLISETKNLIEITFRKISEIPDSMEYSGVILHKRYLDIILRVNAYIGGKW